MAATDTGSSPLNEIHPDYYQIPQEDRERLLAEEAEHAAEEAELREREEEEGGDPADVIASEATEELDDAVEDVDKDDSVDTIDMKEGEVPSDDDSDDDDDDSDDEDESDDGSDGKSQRGRSRRRGRGNGRSGKGRNGSGGRGKSAAKASDQARSKRLEVRKRYKIQDVIQRRQVVLVQVVKEERGNKGAALTTYLSLAGRYCVLMPNTSHGGGISRKISNAGDRKRLKTIIADLNLPRTMGCIVRTAGLSRTKTEIKRDFDYLARLWDTVRENTLGATAPQLIHSDSDLIKRAIRDIYNREIEEVLVEGEGGYKAAKNFMKLLMPSHSRRVKHYSDPVPLFQRYGVEDQLSAMYQPEVQLKSGGYLVINPTEALVSIDINSGKSTREHGIEATAVKTNVEAAQEIARQLRLRDMAGLVVIDFIDMDRNNNVRKVERALRDALKNDRARIQVGRISSFGLLEMSRQRLRTGVLEASTRVCPHCEGTGLVRTASSSALSALRLIEEEAAKGKASQITLTASQEATIYLLNTKRAEITDIEQRYAVTVEITPDGEDEGARMEVKGSGPAPKDVPKFEPIIDEDEESEDEAEASDDADDDGESSARNDRSRGDGSQNDKPKRKRRRRGRRGRGSDRGNANDGDDDTTSSTDKSDDASSDTADADEKPKRSRGGRRRKSADDSDTGSSETDDAGDKEGSKSEDTAAEQKPRRRSRAKKADGADTSENDATSKSDDASDETEEKPKRRRTPRKSAQSDAKKSGAKKAAADTSNAKSDDAAEKPKRRSRAKKTDEVAGHTKSAAEPVEVDADKKPEGYKEPTQEPAQEPAADDKPTGGKQRQGWWQRTFGT